MPNIRDALGMKSGSTEVTVLTTDLVLKNVTLQNLTFGTDAVNAVETGTTSANLVNYGLSIITTTTGADNIYILNAPDAGIEKALYCTFASSSDSVTVSVTTNVAVGVINTTNAYRNIVFGSPGLVKLYGISTSQWAVESLGSTVAGTTTLPTLTT